MDLLLRNRTPQNSYDARILRNRRLDDQREEILRHQREEELMRLNNSWYSKQSDSPHSASPRPYGLMSDVKIRSPSRKTVSSYSPPVGKMDLSRGETSPHRLEAASLPTNSPRAARGLAAARQLDDDVRISRQSTAPPLFQSIPFSYSSTNQAEALTMRAPSGPTSPGAEQEYAVARTCPPCATSRIKLRKAREFSGSQVARLLNDAKHLEEYADYSRCASHSTEENIAMELLEQMRRRDEEEKERRKRDIQTEIERVQSTLQDARTKLQEEDEARFIKQQEAFRLIQESERASLEAIARQREIEETQEHLARLQREELDTKRMQELARRRESVELKLSSIPKSSKDPLHLLNSISAQSPLQEATRRLLEAHSHELDVVAPIIQDILNEPEFAASPWL